ncbi:thiamine ABC transporter substrate-binding protein [Nocardioides sp.]|uniref:thiamine ABC transporter substrate-binding protein n=1 Tax=Nocardioides sp. TaxID=35761 RepID=UPI002D7F3F9F|nr:thiamine ABC transporter substrate-binding protein [Nocardioides sp.]HET8961621.1 thiamine ABC transporter substrate-binding protein [Nocardioides sp.]
MKPVLVSVLALTLPLTACSVVGERSDDSGQPAGAGGGTVVLVTHESFTLPKQVVRQFEEESGYDLETRAAGDAGTLTTKLVLTRDNPTGDVAFGVDNTFASRAVDEGVFAEHGVDLPAGAEDYTLEGEAADVLAPVDNGNVCVNIDKTWFEREDLAPPETLADLADGEYEGLFVTPSALSSSPGLAFLLATIAAYGEDWPGYWQELVDNDTLVLDGWEDAYFGEFTQGSEKGTRPIVLSYDSSPAFTIADDGTSTTSALLDTCFQQVEYAGVLEGAENPEGARALIEFLLSETVQRELPTSMFVFPVRDGVALPPAWAKHAEQPESPYRLDPAEIAANRDAWLEQWRDIVTR